MTTLLEKVYLPYQGSRLKESNRQTFDAVPPFLSAMKTFVALNRTNAPTRTGGVLRLSHEAGMSVDYYNDICKYLVQAGFTSSYVTYDEDHLNERHLREKLLQDLAILPATDTYGQVIQASNGLYEYLWRVTFTAPYIIR